MTTILIPCPTGAPGGNSISTTCGGFQSSWSAFARAAAFIEQIGVLQRDQLRQHVQRRIEHDRHVHPARLPVLPQRPGQPHRRCYTRRHGRRHDELRDLRWRLVCLVGQLGHDQFDRPAEPFAVRAELFAADRGGHRRLEQYPGGVRGLYRPRPDAKLHDHVRRRLRTPSAGPMDLRTISRSPGRIRRRRWPIAHQLVRHGYRQGESRRPDRPHAAGPTAASTIRASPRPCRRIRRSRRSAERSASPTPARTLPMDWDSVDENDGGPTYMSLCASSNHPGGVNALFADGSVHFCKNSINPVIWYGSRDHRRRRGDQLGSVLSRSCAALHVRAACALPADPPTAGPRTRFRASLGACSRHHSQGDESCKIAVSPRSLSDCFSSVLLAAADLLRRTLATLIPVKGKVTYKGKPLTKGVVRFEP